MTLPTFLEPANARITIPLVLLICYAGYHWWRWRMMHPKISVEELPDPEQTAETPSVAAESIPAPKTPQKPVAKPSHASHGTAILRWQARYDKDAAAAKFSFEAFDPRSHKLAHHKAMNGRPEYFVRLGEYAWRRGAMVEAHFWVSMAEFHGVKGLNEWLGAIRQRWINSGRPMERSNVYDQFSTERGTLAYAYLMVVCGFSVPVNRKFIAQMADADKPDAKLILNHLKL